ncbi:hypothetical protein VTN49DRAFT_1407 [Thermomyces lanuginosus]|uniref:uncharacterized protein n=1 Tax=Thermomyces lanuginosus TaxID=5541 RepID=UPI0037442949
MERRRVAVANRRQRRRPDTAEFRSHELIQACDTLSQTLKKGLALRMQNVERQNENTERESQVREVGYRPHRRPATLGPGERGRKKCWRGEGPPTWLIVKIATSVEGAEWW